MKRIITLTVCILAMVCSTFSQSKIVPPEIPGQVVVVNADSTTTLLKKEIIEMKTKSNPIFPIKTKYYFEAKGLSSKSVFHPGKMELLVNLNLKGTLEFQAKLDSITSALKNGGKISKEERKRMKEELSDENNYAKSFFIIKFDDPEEKDKDRKLLIGEYGMFKGGSFDVSSYMGNVVYDVKPSLQGECLDVLLDAEPGEYAIFTYGLNQAYTFSVQ